MSQDPKNGRQRYLESRDEFIALWNRAESVEDVTRATGLKYSSVTYRASKYRKAGFALKLMTDKLPRGPEGSRLFSLSLVVDEATHREIYPTADTYAEPNRLLRLVRLGLVAESRGLSVPAAAPGPSQAASEARGVSLEATEPPERLEGTLEAENDVVVFEDRVEHREPDPVTSFAPPPVAPAVDPLVRLAAMRLDESIPREVYEAEKARVLGTRAPTDDVLRLPPLESL